MPNCCTVTIPDLLATGALFCQLPEILVPSKLHGEEAFGRVTIPKVVGSATLVTPPAVRSRVNVPPEMPLPGIMLQ